MIARRIRRTNRFVVERLERRRLLTEFVVTSTADNGSGSLRQALIDSAASVGSVVTFNIAGSGVHTITPTSALPEVEASIDGSTEPGYAGTPLIEIDGRNAGSVDGLVLRRLGLTIRGLDIHSFSGAGIASPSDGSGLFRGGSNRIEANFIGTDPTGTIADGNGAGIDLNTPNNIIGGLEPGARNVISGNLGFGVRVVAMGPLEGMAPLVTANLIQGNLIGTDVSGRNRLGNGGDGIVFEGSSGNTIGGTELGASNVISANGGDGIELKRRSSIRIVLVPQGNQILGNSIGTDATGALDLGNGQFGIDIQSGSANTVGGTTPGAGNSIIHNFALGLIASPSGGDTIAGNVTSPNQDQVVDLVVAAPGQTATSVVGQPTSVSFTITNNGPATATHVILRIDATSPLTNGTLPPGATVVSIQSSQGAIVPLSAVSIQANLGALAPHASATVTIVTVFSSPSVPLNYSGAISADQVELNPIDNVANTNLLSTPAPATTHLTGVTPILAGSSIGSVRLTFDAPLDPNSAAQPANYRITGPGRDSRFATRDDVAYVIDSVQYDPATHSVLLALRRPLPRLGTFLRVSAGGPGTPGLVDAFGHPVEGDSGSNASETVGIGAKLRYFDATGNLVSISLARGGLIEVQLAPNSNAQTLTLIGAVRGRSVLSGAVRRAQRGASGRTPITTIVGLDMLDSPGIRLTNPPFLNAALPAKKRQ
jgi:Domain of unknown function DUF11